MDEKDEMDELSGLFALPDERPGLLVEPMHLVLDDLYRRDVDYRRWLYYIMNIDAWQGRDDPLDFARFDEDLAPRDDERKTEIRHRLLMECPDIIKRARVPDVTELARLFVNKDRANLLDYLMRLRPSMRLHERLGLSTLLLYSMARRCSACTHYMLQKRLFSDPYHDLKNNLTYYIAMEYMRIESHRGGSWPETLQLIIDYVREGVLSLGGRFNRHFESNVSVFHYLAEFSPGDCPARRRFLETMVELAMERCDSRQLLAFEGSLEDHPLMRSVVRGGADNFRLIMGCMRRHFNMASGDDRNITGIVVLIVEWLFSSHGISHELVSELAGCPELWSREHFRTKEDLEKIAGSLARNSIRVDRVAPNKLEVFMAHFPFPGRDETELAEIFKKTVVESLSETLGEIKNISGAEMEDGDAPRAGTFVLEFSNQIVHSMSIILGKLPPHMGDLRESILREIGGFRSKVFSCPLEEMVLARIQ